MGEKNKHLCLCNLDYFPSKKYNLDIIPDENDDKMQNLTEQTTNTL